MARFQRGHVPTPRSDAPADPPFPRERSIARSVERLVTPEHPSVAHERPPQSANVSGQVLDASGGPIVEALVVARGALGEPLAVARSSAAGQFSLAVAERAFELSAEAEFYAQDAVWLDAPLHGVRLVLSPAVELVGRVVSATTHEPVADVSVTATPQRGTRARATTTRSASDGSFRFAALAAAPYELAALASGWRSEPRQIELEIASAGERVLLELERAGELAGVVRSAGAACTEGYVEIRGPEWRSSRVEPDGSVRFVGLRTGPYEVDVECSGAVARSERLELGIAALAREWDLASGLAVRGRIENGAGAALPDTRVRVRPSSGSSAQRGTTCRSDAAGEFLCSGLEPGSYDCLALGELEPLTDPVGVELDGSDTPDVVLRAFPTGSIRVVVTGSSPEHLAGWAVVARAPDGTSVEAVRHGEEFVLDGLRVGSYQVSLATDAADEDSAEHVDLVREGELANVRLRAPAAASISGRVVDGAGVAVVDAWVQAEPNAAVFGGSLRIPAVSSDADGRFTLSGLLPGRYDLSASSNLGNARAPAVQTSSAFALLRVELPARLSGTVRTEEGEPVASFALTLQASSGEGSVLRFGNGSFSLPRLAPGHYDLSVSSELGHALEHVSLEPSAERSLALVVRPGGESSATDDDETTALGALIGAL